MIKAWLTSIAHGILEDLKPAIISAVSVAVREQIPIIIHAVVAAVAETAGQLTVDTVDKVTDVIPGRLDDEVFDHLVGDVLQRLGIQR